MGCISGGVGVLLPVVIHSSAVSDSTHTYTPDSSLQSADCSQLTEAPPPVESGVWAVGSPWVVWGVCLACVCVSLCVSVCTQLCVWGGECVWRAARSGEADVAYTASTVAAAVRLPVRGFVMCGSAANARLTALYHMPVLMSCAVGCCCCSQGVSMRRVSGGSLL